MRKLIVILCISGLVLWPCSYLMAGGVDNRSNYSGEYVRTLNRNAATDSLDAIVYNPAGVMTMEDGTYGNFSVHYVMKDYTNVVDGESLEQDKTSFVPALFGLYKKDKWAGFFAFTIPAGGGEVEYKSGNATTRIGATGLINMLNAAAIGGGAPGAVYGPIAYERLEGKSFYFGYTAGMSYKFNDTFSCSLAGRYIDSNKEASAEFQITPTDIGTALGQPARTAILDYDDNADGFGLILGLHLNFENLNIGLRYETETDLDFTYDVHTDSITGLPAGLGSQLGIIDGREHSRNLPALLAAGAGYRFTPRLRADINFTNYFQEDADWGGAENSVDNGWEAGVTVEYTVNTNLKLSAGYLYTVTGLDKHRQYLLKEAPELDASSLGAGFVYYMGKNLKIDCGIGVVDYKSASYTDISSGTPLVIGLEKDVVMFSAGVQYRF